MSSYAQSIFIYGLHPQQKVPPPTTKSQKIHSGKEFMT